jgi:hypothetical protein
MISITRVTSALLSTAKIANRREISTEFGQVEGLTGLSSTADDTANDNFPHRLQNGSAIGQFHRTRIQAKSDSA